MGSTSQTGKDVIQLDGRVFADFADGEYITADVPNDISSLKTSKNGNTIVAMNESGRQMPIKIRILAGSSDDKWLNSRLQEWKNDAATFIPFVGMYAKRSGDAHGNVNTVVYQLSGGYPKKQPTAKSHAEGDTDQSVAVWEINFANGDRSVQ